MTEYNQWRPVSKSDPCPICGKPDWCGRSDDVVRCMRPPDETPSGWTIVKVCGDSGVVYRPQVGGTSEPHRRPQSITVKTKPLPGSLPQAWLRRLETLQEATLAEGRLEALSGDIGVSVASLAALGVAWSEEAGVWLIPEVNHLGEVVGVGIRKGARKWQVKGSKRGLVVPSGPRGGSELWAVEGMTDTAACLDLGHFAVGRPSNAYGGEILAAWLDRHCWHGLEHVVVWGENDRKDDGSWPGRDGARHVAGTLRVRGWRAEVRMPPEEVKDIRDALRHGAML